MYKNRRNWWRLSSWELSQRWKFKEGGLSKGEHFLAQGHDCLFDWWLFSCSFERFLLTTFIDYKFIQKWGVHSKNQRLPSDNKNMGKHITWLHHAISILLIASDEQKTWHGPTPNSSSCVLVTLSCWTQACLFSGLIFWSCSDHYPWLSHVLISSLDSASLPRPCVWTVNRFPFQESHLIFITHLF